MRTKLGIIAIVTAAVLLLTAGLAGAVVKYLPMTEFGIRVPVKNLYNQQGKSAVGTVTNAAKARLGAGLEGAKTGQSVRVTYMGNGMVKIENRATGRIVSVEVTESVP